MHTIQSRFLVYTTTTYVLNTVLQLVGFASLITAPQAICRLISPCLLRGI